MKTKIISYYALKIYVNMLFMHTNMVLQKNQEIQQNVC